MKKFEIQDLIFLSYVLSANKWVEFLLVLLYGCRLYWLCIMLIQDDIDVACGAEDSDFQPVLKPYQLVGVNFLLLLYRKGIGGGISSNFVVISCISKWLTTSISMPNTCVCLCCQNKYILAGSIGSRSKI